jgi:hypothetical protein
MLKISIFLTALLLLPLPARSDDKEKEKQAGALAECYGAMSGVYCFDVYAALSDLEAVAKASGRSAVDANQIARHLKGLGVLTKYTKQTRPLFSDDKVFIKFLDNLDAMAAALKEQGEALSAYLASGSAADLKKAHARKEAARALLCPMLSLPESVSRDSVP